MGSRGLVQASIRSRVFAWFMDLLVVFFGSVVLELVLGGMSGLANPIFSVVNLSMGLGIYVVNAAVVVAYFVVLRGPRFGPTLGCSAAHIRVVSESGAQPSYRQAVVRFLVSAISAAVLFLGYAAALADPHRRTLHDRAAGTVVVKAQ